MSKCFYIDHKGNNIPISVKPRNVNSKRPINMVYNKYVDCLINLSHMLIPLNQEMHLMKPPILIFNNCIII